MAGQVIPGMEVGTALSLPDGLLGPPVGMMSLIRETVSALKWCEEIIVGHSLCVLAAGLLIGQAQDITVIGDSVRPGCNCGAQAQSGWIPVQSSVQTRTWTQTGTWTPAGGWTWRTQVSGSVEDRPILTRISERLSDMFGRQEASRPGTVRHHTASSDTAWHTSGWQTSGWHEDFDVSPDVHVQSAGQPVALPVIRTESSALPLRSAPPRRVTLSEPPLLEVAPAPQIVRPSQPESVKPASFEPQVPVPAPAP
jgi:hypothetical protein